MSLFRSAPFSTRGGTGGRPIRYLHRGGRPEEGRRQAQAVQARREQGTARRFLVAGFVVELTKRKRTEAALRATEARLADRARRRSPSATNQHGTNSGASPAGLYERIIRSRGAADALRRGQYSRIRSGAGRAEAFGIARVDPQSAAGWEWVGAYTACTCGVAFTSGRREMVQDVETCAYMAGTQGTRRISPIRHSSRSVDTAVLERRPLTGSDLDALARASRALPARAAPFRRPRPASGRPDRARASAGSAYAPARRGSG